MEISKETEIAILTAALKHYPQRRLIDLYLVPHTAMPVPLFAQAAKDYHNQVNVDWWICCTSPQIVIALAKIRDDEGNFRRFDVFYVGDN